MTDEIENVAETTAPKQRGRPFEKGQSGNPAGRPPGSRHKHLVAAELLLDGEAEKLTRKAIELALAGDSACLRLCLDKILPPRKERPVSIDLPAVSSIQDVPQAMATIVERVSSGELSPAEGAAIAGLLEKFSEAAQLGELLTRVEALESRPNL